MMEMFSPLPAISEPLAFGVLGALLTLFGSVLRSGLNPVPRKIGNYCCVFGLFLMTIGFFCIASNTSLLSYAQKV